MTTVEQLNYRKNQREAALSPATIISEKKINGQVVEKKDEFVTEEKADASNDGKFSTWQAIKNFGKGLISPVTAMFSSVKGFLIGAGMMAAGAVAVAATGGAILPALLAMGIAFGAFEGVKGIYKIATAKNGDDVEKAFLDIGTATSSIGLSFLGVKTSLKTAGITTEGMSNTQAVVSCFKNLPESIRQSYANIKELPSNLKQDLSILKSEVDVKEITAQKKVQEAPTGSNLTMDELYRTLEIQDQLEYNRLLGEITRKVGAIEENSKRLAELRRRVAHRLHTDSANMNN